MPRSAPYKKVKIQYCPRDDKVDLDNGTIDPSVHMFSILDSYTTLNGREAQYLKISKLNSLVQKQKVLGREIQGEQHTWKSFHRIQIQNCCLLSYIKVQFYKD